MRYSLKELIKVELPVEMHVKLSVTLTDRLGPEILTVLEIKGQVLHGVRLHCLLYTSPSPRDLSTSRMPSSA